MKLAIVSTLGFGLTLAQANYEEPTDQWQPPGPDDCALIQWSCPRWVASGKLTVW